MSFGGVRRASAILERHPLLLCVRWPSDLWGVESPGRWSGGGWGCVSGGVCGCCHVWVGGCRAKAAEVVGAETRETLEGPSGHGRLKFSRLELHLYNVRHIQHHTGQLTAFLRRVGVKTGWVKTGQG